MQSVSWGNIPIIIQKSRCTAFENSVGKSIKFGYFIIFTNNFGEIFICSNGKGRLNSLAREEKERGEKDENKTFQK